MLQLLQSFRSLTAIPGGSSRARARASLFIAAALSLPLCAAHAVEGDPERGREVAQICVACHGLDGAGNDAGGFPRLDIQTPRYLVQQLELIKSGARQSPVMQPFMALLDEQKMADVAAYYAAQSASVPAPQAPEAELLALGRKLVEHGDWERHLPSCNSCHGPGSQGVGDTFPALGGQHASYIESQLKAWQTGSRSGDPLQLMTAVAERMTETDIKAAAAYLASQPAKQ